MISALEGERAWPLPPHWLIRIMGVILLMSPFENRNFLLVMVSEARTIPRSGSEGESNPSRGCLLDHAAPGSSTETASFAATAFKEKCNGRELPEAA
jgi:hypothetical protein